MRRATRIDEAGSWSGPTADSVVLDWDARHRRRRAMTGRSGLAFLLDLPEARIIRDGDALRLEDGARVLVIAAPEPLMEVTGQDQGHLLRLAWHLGNRHLPTELLGDRLRVRHDHVIAEMLRGLGATVQDVEAPFNPEGGAYGGTVATHGHD